MQKASGSRTAPGVGFYTFLLLRHIRISVSMRAVRTDDVLTKNGDVIILFECFEKNTTKVRWLLLIFFKVSADV